MRAYYVAAPLMGADTRRMKEIFWRKKELDGGRQAYGERHFVHRE